MRGYKGWDAIGRREGGREGEEMMYQYQECIQE